MKQQKKLFEELHLNGLESWPPELVEAAWSLLAKYHELVCTHSTKHVIKVIDNIPFKEWFRAEVHNPTMVESGHCLEQEVCVATGCALVQMHVTDRADAQREDPILSAVLDWLKAQKETDLKALLVEHASSEEGQMILWKW